MKVMFRSLCTTKLHCRQASPIAGQYPIRNGMTTASDHWEFIRFTTSFSFFGRKFKAQGYATSHLGKSHGGSKCPFTHNLMALMSFGNLYHLNTKRGAKGL
jgi:arylsulfatase A-like enzyme